MKKIEPLLRDLEIQLALSALPAHLRENATVYVLNLGKGFEVARKGTNGFHALVARTGDDAFRGSWPLTEYRDDILYPIAFDSAGAKEPSGSTRRDASQGYSFWGTKEDHQRPVQDWILQSA